MRRSDLGFTLLTVATGVGFFALISYVFWIVPSAQIEAGGLTQKIFYFHVPAAYALYLSGATCLAASAAYLMHPTDARDAWARSGAETAVAFGLIVLVSGPLWAKKAWGVYWTWDPRLTSLLLAELIYLAIVLLRRFAGDGEAERKFAAAFGIIGTAILPIVHFATKLWGGNHPRVIGQGEKSLGDPSMVYALLLGFLCMTLLAASLLWLRARLHQNVARLEVIEEHLALHYE